MHWLDPDALPETRGVVTRFLLNPHGDLDGMVLRNGKQVHFPPHMSRWVSSHIKIGDVVRVRGVKPRAADIVAAVALRAKGGSMLVDAGPPEEARRRPKGHRGLERHAGLPSGSPMQVGGTVSMSLFGAKGELHGALLEDGTSLRVTPRAAADLVEYLSAGASVYAWGIGRKTRFGIVIDVDDIAFWVDADGAAEDRARDDATFVAERA